MYSVCTVVYVISCHVMLCVVLYCVIWFVCVHVCVCEASQQMKKNIRRLETWAQKVHIAVPSQALYGVLRISRLINWMYLQNNVISIFLMMATG